LSKRPSLYAAKIPHKTLYIEQLIPACHYVAIYGGVVQISTEGMGAQSRLHGWQFSVGKRIVIEIMRVKVSDKDELD
jgi:hypothetical protein